METKNLEEMTKEELTELVNTLNKELEETKEKLVQTEESWSRTIEARELLEKKILAGKAFWEIM